MTLEPDDLQPADSPLSTSAESNEVEQALHLLDLNPAGSSSLPSPEESAAALDSELEAAVRQSATSPSTPSSKSPLDDLYATLLEKNPSPSLIRDNQAEDPDWWVFQDFPPISATMSSRAARSKPSGSQHPGLSPEPPLPPSKRSDFDWIEAPTQRDTITALTDLIPKIAQTTLANTEERSLPTWDSVPRTPNAPNPDEGYLHASPEEDLLPTSEELLESDKDLQIDAATLQKLESDLNRLEGLDADLTIHPDSIDAEGILPTDAELDAIFPTFVPGEVAQQEEQEEFVAEPPTTLNPPTQDEDLPPQEWYLGLDFGSTGVSAVLLHRPTAALYPLYWWKSTPPHPPEQVFRLPSTAYVSLENEPATIVAVGFAALDLQSADAALGEDNTSGLLLSGFKSCLNIGLSWRDDEGQEQPIVQWSQEQVLPLERIQMAVQTLLATIRQSASVYDRSVEDMISTVPPLAGIIIGTRDTYSEAYRFNLREAVLNAGLVKRPEQVAFLEESIAAVLSALPHAPHIYSSEGNWQFSPQWGGTTLTIEAGATATELVLVDLPIHLDELTHTRFWRHSFAYGGDAIDQDIISQLLLQDHWLQGECAALQPPEFPKPGEPDVANRIAFGQWLQSSALGQFLLDTATQIKMKLQEQERCTWEWGERSIRLQRHDLESRILVPYVQRLNREFNQLLSHTGVAVEGINQALCTGGNVSWAAIARWLRQKLPNATIAQDVYPNDRSASCSRVAYGLAALPLYPNLLGTLSPHYSDYFLLRELIDAFPQCTLSLSEILPLLERRCINVRVCQPRILEFLEGRLPQGLVPSKPDSQWLTSASQQHPLYQDLITLPLFESIGQPLTESIRDRSYRPNALQIQRFSQYLHQITADKDQTLEDPPIVSWIVG